MIKLNKDRLKEGIIELCETYKKQGKSHCDDMIEKNNARVIKLEIEGTQITGGKHTIFIHFERRE